MVYTYYFQIYCINLCKMLPGVILTQYISERFVNVAQNECTSFFWRFFLLSEISETSSDF